MFLGVLVTGEDFGGADMFRNLQEYTLENFPRVLEYFLEHFVSCRSSVTRN